MARTKAKPQTAAISKTWIIAGGKVLPSTGKALPESWTHWCHEGDEKWTARDYETDPPTASPSTPTAG